MKLSLYRLTFLSFVALAAGVAAQQEQRQHSAEYRSMEQKAAYLKQNAANIRPDPKPTEITQAEANAYFAEGGVKLPKGVTKLQLAAQPGVLDAHALVDFDTITQKARAGNPLFSVFTGVHDVHGVAHAEGANGTGTIRVESVYLDNIQVPEIALEFFVERYLKPKYPSVGMTSTFKLPLRIDSAVVESGQVRLVQK